MTRVPQLAALGLVLLVLAAILVQDHSGALPLGLFNQGRDLYAWLSALCLAGAAAVAAVFVVELATGRLRRLAGTLRALLVSLLLLEGMLLALDRLLVSGPDSRLGGPYTERRTGDGRWVYTGKAHPGSPFGFRTATPHALRPERPRLLFLGDSYTQGSGRAAACNYPDVVERELSRLWGTGVEVMNAGVAGHGPEDSRALLALLDEQGYRFDAVVYNLFEENDFTDNLPGTRRRVVSGLNQRFPDAAWLAWAHPLNSTTFRTALFVVRMGTISRGEATAAVLDTGPCSLEPTAPVEPDPALRALVAQRLSGNARVAAAPEARDAVLDTLRGLAGDATALGAPFVLVTFPARVDVDVELRRALAVPSERLEPTRALGAAARAAAGPAIDVAPALGPGHYRSVDTHLSDLGNVVAGRHVARALADLLPAPDE